MDFEIYPSFVDIVVEVVIVDVILWDAGDFDFDILGIYKWCC